jgi:hypothetical protein
MSLTDNPFTTVPNPRGWNSTLRLPVFLSHSNDCKNICDTVVEYLQNDINNSLRPFNLSIDPIMYENWPPSLKSGTASTSSLAGVEISSVVFTFIYKRHGKIRNEEIFYSIELFNQKKIQDVHIFFKKIPWYHTTKEDEKVTELRRKLEENLTYYSYDSETDVIRKVSQIIIKAICELKKQEGQIVPEEMLLGSGERLLINGGAEK